jgi:thioredoxin reductase
VEIDEREVARIDDGAVVFTDGDERACAGLLVPVSLHQRAPRLAEQLGAELATPGRVAVDALAVDAQFRTSVPGLFAAGDASAQMQSVAGAVAAGQLAAATLVMELVVEESGAARALS